MFKWLIILSAIIFAVFAMEKEEKLNAILQCGMKFNISANEAVNYLNTNDPAPYEIKEFFVCLLSKFDMIFNETLTEVSFKMLVESNHHLSNNSKFLYIAVIEECLDTTEIDIYEQLFKYLRCKEQRYKQQSAKYYSIIANCEKDHNISAENATHFLSTNDPVDQNVKDFHVCHMKGLGFIINDTITNETVKYAINSEKYISPEEKFNWINELTICMNSTESDLHEFVLNMLRCREQNLNQGESFNRK